MPSNGRSAIAPMLPYLLLLFSAALTMRRLVDRARLSAGLHRSVLRRIDQRHVHADADRPPRLAAGVARAWRWPGLPIRGAHAAARPSGIATALSLTIGLEMLIYIAIAGAAQVLFWVADPAERRRLAAYAATLAGGAAIGFLLFASYANRGAGLRRAVAGVAVRRAARRRADDRAGDAVAGRLEAAAGACGRRRARSSPPSTPDVAALPVAAGRRIARSRPAVAEPCPRGAAGLSPRLADRRADRRRCRSPALIGWALLAWVRRARSRPAAADPRGGGCPALPRPRCCSGRRARARRRRCSALAGAAALVWLLVAAGCWQLEQRAGARARRVVAGGGARRSARRCRWSLDYFPQTSRRRARSAIDHANAACPSLCALRPVAQQPQGHGLHLRRFRAADDHRHPPRRRSPAPIIATASRSST